MSNAFSNPTIFAKEMIRHLKNSLVVGNTIHRGYKSEWSKEHNGYKPGQSISIDLPHYFRVKDGATVDTADILSRSTTLSLNNRKHVAYTLTSAEQTYNMDMMSEKLIKPAMMALAEYIDRDTLGMYTDIANQVGTPGTTPSNFYTIGQAAARLTEEAAPKMDRHCVLNSQATLKLADNLKGVLHREIVGTAIQQASVGPIAGMKLYESESVNRHTCGTWGGSSAVLVDDTVANGDNTINLDQNGAGSALTVKHGDIFTIADVNSVNPASGQSTGQARNFVVDADATFADAGGGDYNLDITCTPGTDPYAIYDSTANETYLPYQNIDTLPVNNAAVTIPGSSGLIYPVNLAYHRDCMAIAMVPLVMPQSAVWGTRMTTEDGLSVRCYKYLDGANDAEVIRFDILYAKKCINPFLGCRIAG